MQRHILTSCAIASHVVRLVWLLGCNLEKVFSPRPDDRKKKRKKNSGAADFFHILLTQAPSRLVFNRSSYSKTSSIHSVVTKAESNYFDLHLKTPKKYYADQQEVIASLASAKDK